ncbi:C6 zinc finger domain protein [Stagonosporopsis vannaccii]|nr:C6 zinc finger domain protein [Stagonosporopsis vannaccii]
MSMMVDGTDRRKEYHDTYGVALEGVRAVLDRSAESVGPTVAIASMCLALSEVLVPTSSDGYKTHLRGVTAMMQSRSPPSFKEGVAHLMFVGVRPLMVLDSILSCKRTFLMDEEWQQIPFSVHPASRMQELLGHATTIPPLLEAIKKERIDPYIIHSGFLRILSTLEEWEASFLSEGMMYRAIDPGQLDLSTNTQLLPNPCFAFADVSQANSLTHCWSFRIVCLLQLLRLDNVLARNEKMVHPTKQKRSTEVECLCDMVCRALPFLLQKEMRFYGSMSAGFPLHIVSESLQTLKPEDCRLKTWYGAIKDQLQSQRIVLYEEMVETKTLL